MPSQSWARDILMRLDYGLPPASLGPYLRELAALMARHGVDGLMYGHFGDGCVHVRIDFPLRDRPGVLRSFTQDAARLAASSQDLRLVPTTSTIL